METLITLAPSYSKYLCFCASGETKGCRLMKLLAVSIVSKFSSKVRLCWKQAKQKIAQDFKNLGKIKRQYATTYMFSLLNSHYRNDTWNENCLCQKILTLYGCYHNSPLNEVNAAGKTDILSLDITDKGSAIAVT